MAHALAYERIKIFLALSIFMLVALPAIASPANGERNDPPPFTRSESYKYTIRDDGLMDSVQTVDLFIGNEQAASAAAQQSIEFSSYYTDVHIAEAATIKADGRLLPVPANSIVFRDKPASLLETSYSLDAKVAEVGFPDLAPGDRIRYTVVYRALRAMVPGGNGYFAFSVDPVERYSSVKVSLDAPVGQKVHTAETGFNHKVLNADGRVLHEWTLTRPLAYRAAEANAVAPEDGAAFMAFSTYPDWHAVGYGFSSRAEPMAAVTPEIASLAAQITQGKTGVREQAQAIYAWVTSNIRYVSIVLGAGGLVPRSAASIVANRYGDCKDHVTLMRALLTARGIASEYALINVGRSIYKTFSIPMLLFDHVIVYIPELNLYVGFLRGHSGFMRRRCTRTAGTHSSVFRKPSRKTSPITCPQAGKRLRCQAT